MRVLITGGTGLVGCHTAAALIARGHEVRLLVRDPARIPEVFGPLGIGAADHAVGDVTDRRAVATALAGCDAAVHAAALFSMDIRRAEEVQFTNVVGSQIVLGTAAELGLDPIVHLSSTSALFPPDGPLLTPDTSVKRPAEMYACSKANAERIARRLQEERFPVTIFYPGQVWGPCDPTLNGGIRAVLAFARSRLFPDTPGGIPMVDARDLSTAIAAAVQPGRGPRRYMAGGSFLSFPQVADAFTRVTGRRFFTPRAPGALLRGIGRCIDLAQRRLGLTFGPTYQTMLTVTRGVPCDDSRAADELGFKARSIDETLRDTLLWMLAHDEIDPAQVGWLAG